MEKVDRIICSPAKQCGRDFSVMLRCLYEKGYAAEYRVINAADYGYVQRRRRTFIMACHNKTSMFRNLAESICVQGFKEMYRHIMQKGILAKAFLVQSHNRLYVESWIDELEYAHIPDISKEYRVYLYNAGTMMNGRIYSADEPPQQVMPTSLGGILERVPVDNHHFLRDEYLPKWIYAKGARHEKRRR